MSGEPRAGTETAFTFPKMLQMRGDKEELNGLVLVGGSSTRMGRDKSLIAYHGRPQREYLAGLLGRYCDSVFLSCRRDQSIASGLHPLYDRFPVKGPLNGILSAFAHRPEASWLIVAVDMPFIRTATLELLIANRDPSCVATCFYNPELMQPEPLLTLWERHAGPLLLKFAEAGNGSPREFLKLHPVKLLDPPDDRTLVNVNYPP